MQKARRQFEIVSGSSHSDGEAAISQSNLEDLLDREQVVGTRCGATFHPADRHRNHRDVHGAFPTLSSRSSVTAIAWRLSSLPRTIRNQLQQARRPVRLFAFSSLRRGANQALQDFRRDTAKELRQQDEIAHRPQRLPERRPRQSRCLLSDRRRPPIRGANSRTPRSCRSCKSSSAETIASVCLCSASSRRSVGSGPLGVSVNGIQFIAMGLYPSRLISIFTRSPGKHDKPGLPPFSFFPPLCGSGMSRKPVIDARQGTLASRRHLHANRRLLICGRVSRRIRMAAGEKIDQAGGIHRHVGFAVLDPVGDQRAYAQAAMARCKLHQAAALDTTRACRNRRYLDEGVESFSCMPGLR